MSETKFDKDKELIKLETTLLQIYSAFIFAIAAGISSMVYNKEIVFSFLEYAIIIPAVIFFIFFCVAFSVSLFSLYSKIKMLKK
jgi:hypothetical protein